MNISNFKYKVGDIVKHEAASPDGVCLLRTGSEGEIVGGHATHRCEVDMVTGCIKIGQVQDSFYDVKVTKSSEHVEIGIAHTNIGEWWLSPVAVAQQGASEAKSAAEPEGYMRPCENCGGKGTDNFGKYTVPCWHCDGTGIHTEKSGD
jgi:hypothetical protein